jgi:hypothetical protein
LGRKGKNSDTCGGDADEDKDNYNNNNDDENSNNGCKIASLHSNVAED